MSASRQRARMTSTQLTPEQQNAYFLTPQQQQELFDRRQQSEAAQREADISDQEAKAQHDVAVAQLQQARAKSAQGAVDEMIARGMLQSGTARGALADIEVAAFQQKQSLDAALTAMQQRNIAVRSQAQAGLDRIGTYATGLAGENIATGVRSMPSGAALPPTSAYAQPSGPVASQAAKVAQPTPSKAASPSSGGFKPFQPSWKQPPAKKYKPPSPYGAPGPGGPSRYV